MKFGFEHFPEGTVFEAMGTMTGRKSKFTAIGCYSHNGIIAVKLTSTLSRKQRENFPNIKERWLPDNVIEISHVVNILQRGTGKTSVEFYAPKVCCTALRAGSNLTTYMHLDLIYQIVYRKMHLPKDFDIDRLNASDMWDYLLKHGIVKIIEFDLDTSIKVFKLSYQVEMFVANAKRLEKAVKQNFNRFLKPKKQQINNTMKMLTAALEDDGVDYSYGIG